jgi:pimeloyl-ACP methyl ester carboxylesterase
MPARVPAHLPVAYLPGASGRGSVFLPIATYLAARRAPLLVDYPGLSDAPLRSPIDSLDDLTRHVADGLPSRFDVVSLSMGATVALRLALAYPERVRRLVLVAPAGGVDVLALGGVDWRPAFRERRPESPGWFLEDAVDLSDRLAAVAAPTLLVLGERDLVAPVAVGAHLLARLPDARMETMPDATHDLEEEFPDLVASLVEAHLRR